MPLFKNCPVGDTSFLQQAPAAGGEAGHLISPTNARWDIQILSEVPIPTWCKYFQLVPLLEINIMPTVSRS
jgi:hypothetical protein